jgi:hypothetical protein
MHRRARVHGLLLSNIFRFYISEFRDILFRAIRVVKRVFCDVEYNAACAWGQAAASRAARAFISHHETAFAFWTAIQDL